MLIAFITQGEGTHVPGRFPKVPTKLKRYLLLTGVSLGGLAIEGFAAAVGELVIAAEAVNLA